MLATASCSGTPRTSRTVYLRLTTPVRGPILARFTIRPVDDGCLDETGRLWSASGQLLAERRRQLARLIESPLSKDR
jgi:hypothetical protein